MRKMVLMLSLVMLAACGESEPNSVAPTKIDFLACMGNEYCEIEAIKRFDSMAEFSEVHARQSIITPIQQFVASDPSQYWRLMAKVADCSTLAYYSDRQRCAVYQSHVKKPLKTCLSLVESEQNTIDIGGPFDVRYTINPRRDCIEVQATKMSSLEECNTAVLDVTLQAACRKAYKTHFAEKACAELPEKKQARCLYLPQFYAAKDFSHCINSSESNCIGLTFIRSQINGKPIPDCSSAPLKHGHRATCDDVMKKVKLVENADISACTTKKCIQELSKNYAFKSSHLIKTGKELRTFCAAAIFPDFSKYCIEQMSQYVAQHTNDLSRCLLSPDANYFYSDCVITIVDYNKYANFSVCDQVGQFNSAKEKEGLKKVCHRRVMRYAGVAQRDPLLCQDRWCRKPLLKALVQDVRDGKPAAYEKCKDMGHFKNDCQEQLREQDALTNFRVEFCNGSSCIEQIVLAKPETNCAVLNPGKYVENEALGWSELRDAERNHRDKGVLYLKCLDIQNTYHAKAKQSLVLCSTNDCLDSLMAVSNIKDCSSIKPTKERAQSPERPMSEQHRLYEYCQDTLMYKTFTSQAISYCSKVHHEMRCVRQMIAHHKLQKTLTRLESKECKPLDYQRQCAKEVLHAQALASNNILLCHDEDCFEPLIADALYKQRKLPNTNCKAYEYPEKCEYYVRDQIARFTTNLALCPNKQCLEVVVKSIYKHEVQVAYLALQGLKVHKKLFDKSRRTATLKAKSAEEWRALVSQHVAEKQSDYLALWIEANESICQSLVKKTRQGYSYQLLCQQHLQDEIAFDKDDFRQCGSSDCVRQFINIRVINTAADCEKLNTDYVDTFFKESLVEGCKRRL